MYILFLRKRDHFTLFDCYEVQNLWLQLYTWLKSNIILILTLSADTIILGLADKRFDIIILATKYYIYIYIYHTI